MSLNLATIPRRTATLHPLATALIHEGGAIRYGELHDRIRRCAAGLHRLGVRRGRHVALLLPNVPEFTVAYFASHWLGAPVVPLNTLLAAEEIAWHLQDSDAVVLVVWRDLLGPAQPALARAESCRTVIVAGASSSEALPDGSVPFESMLDATPAGGDPAATMPDDTAVVLYTSGTTGRPKGAELTHFNLFYNAEVGTRLLPIGPDTVALGALPFFHSFGQTVIQNTLMMRGGTIVLMRRFEASAALRLMQDHRVTYFAGVPTMYFALLHCPEAAARDLRALRICQSGGAAMPVEVMRSFESRYGVEVREGYGLSETSPVASFNVLDAPGRPGSIGVPIEGVEFRLVDEQGRIIEEPMVPGEICIKGHNVMKGYYKRPEATAEAVTEGWFRTGDIAHRDADGYYFIVDRRKDMIVRGGYNVYPREVEEVLYAHPAVAEAAVVGFPHEALGEEVLAFLVLRAGAEATEREIIDYCRERMAAFKYPRRVEFRDALPKGPTGKILKRALRH